MLSLTSSRSSHPRGVLCPHSIVVFPYIKQLSKISIYLSPNCFHFYLCGQMPVLFCGAFELRMSVVTRTWTCRNLVTNVMYTLSLRSSVLFDSVPNRSFRKSMTYYFANNVWTRQSETATLIPRTWQHFGLYIVRLSSPPVGVRKRRSGHPWPRKLGVTPRVGTYFENFDLHLAQ